jgi:hypothetical protein
MDQQAGSIHARRPGEWHAWLDLPPRRRVYLGQFDTVEEAVAAFRRVKPPGVGPRGVETATSQDAEG